MTKLSLVTSFMKENKKKKVISLRVLLMLIFITLTGGALWWKWASSPPDLISTTTAFSVNRGESVESIANNLQKNNLIRSKAAFKLWVMIHNLSKSMQAGEYQISPASNLSQIAWSLTHGIDDIQVTLLEGWRREEMADELQKKIEEKGENFSREEFLQETEGLEGFLFPDTYHIPRLVQTGEISQLLRKTFDIKVDEAMRASIENQGLTVDQAIVIASIVEREARGQIDRPIVAGILIKRWRSGWPLQADATIQYILGYQVKEHSWWKKSLTRQDLEIDSAYNTYTNEGLPPAPICNPSLASIKAVANQEVSAYWYYISDLQGNMHFAKNLQEHNANIASYLGK